MIPFRVIPALLLQDGSLVKTVRFKSPKYIGEPVNTIRIFNESAVDELMIWDINATKLNQPPNYSLLHDITSECFMPLTYGGGVHSIESAAKIFRIGYEKIALNRALHTTPALARDLVRKFGSQSMVAVINVKRDLWGQYRPYCYVTRKVQRITLQEQVKQVVELGFGELVLNFVDNDGRMQGYNTQVIRPLVDMVDVPLIVLGGAGSFEDVRILKDMGVSAAAAGSLFVYQNTNKSVLINYLNEDQMEALHDEA